MDMTEQLNFFATCPKNLEELLEQELISFGAINTKKTVAGVNFQGDLTIAYRACLWSRLANRILFPIRKVAANDANALYYGIKNIDWSKHFNPTQTFIVDFAGHSQTITNTQFGAQKVKDAIVDQMRDAFGKRPSINKDKPDIRINVYLQNDVAAVSFDLSGESLHQRNYRQQTGAAPLKENLAAAILLRARWPHLAKQNASLIDPMCGSGTILIEAAMIAADIAPGLLRKSFGLKNWLQHQPELWQQLWDEAEQRREVGLKNLPPIFGFDIDEKIIGIAQENIKYAGLSDYIKLQTQDISQLEKPLDASESGLIISNPPYGTRIGNETDLILLYQILGEKLKTEFPGWEAAILAGNTELAKNMRLRKEKEYAFFNGAIACKLLLFKLHKPSSSPSS